MRWRIQFESMWSDELPVIAHAEIPHQMNGRERIAFVKRREAAQQLIASLFPRDED